MIDLPSQTVLIVGVGGAGSEASKLCAAFGMRVLGSDPRVTDPPPGQRPDVIFRAIGPGYFNTMGIPIVGGRDFTDQDKADSKDVVVISEKTAQHFWPGQDPVGI